MMSFLDLLGQVGRIRLRKAPGVSIPKPTTLESSALRATISFQPWWRPLTADVLRGERHLRPAPMVSRPRRLPSRRCHSQTGTQHRLVLALPGAFPFI